MSATFGKLFIHIASHIPSNIIGTSVRCGRGKQAFRATHWPRTHGLATSTRRRHHWDYASNGSASEMTYIVSGRALNSSHSLTRFQWLAPGWRP